MSAVKRMTKYLTAVQAMREEGVEWVSSQDLADALGLTSSTVRQDLSHLEFSGTSKRGYQTRGLEDILSKVLGADTTWRVVVVGAGNLGKALALHEEFPRRGFNIRGIFDNASEKVGTDVGRFKVRDMRDLPAFAGKEKIDVAVIAVPTHAAQQVADIIIASGVKGLLNLALAHIIAPQGVHVVDSRIVASLLELTHSMKFGS